MVLGSSNGFENMRNHPLNFIHLSVDDTNPMDVRTMTWECKGHYGLVWLISSIKFDDMHETSMLTVEFEGFLWT